jgi:hypothetical protein
MAAVWRCSSRFRIACMFSNQKASFLQLVLRRPIGQELEFHVDWGCDSWAMTDKCKKKLRVFYHKSIRSILNINMHEVEALRITNEQVRKRFLHTPDIVDIIHYRQLKWIGKIARMNESRAPRRLMASWCDNPRKAGRPQVTYRNSFAETIAKVIPGLPQDARLQEWITVAKEERAWNTAIAAWWASVTHNPLLGAAARRVTTLLQ